MTLNSRNPWPYDSTHRTRLFWEPFLIRRTGAELFAENLDHAHKPKTYMNAMAFRKNYQRYHVIQLTLKIYLLLFYMHHAQQFFNIANLTLDYSPYCQCI